MRISIPTLIPFGLIILLMQGCATPIGTALDTTGILALNKESGADYEYLLSSGDIVSIKFFYNPKLNEDIAIRPDGKISLQLIGDVQAAGLTPARLTKSLNTEYARYFQSSTGAYALGVGDTVSVKFYLNKELNDDVIIRPDGKISLQLAGEIQAAGLTPAQLKSALEKEYSKVFDQPELAVIVRDFKLPDVTVSVKESASRRVYVGGEIARPGIVPLNGSMRVLDALLQAGGALDTAEMETVVLIRYNGSPKPGVYSLDLNEVLRGKTPDVTLRPYDVIYIPKTAIAQVNLFVDQYINKLVPRSISFPFTYSMNPEVQVQTK